MNDSAKFERSKVVQIVQSVISKMEVMSGDSLGTLRAELMQLEGAIEKTRHDLAITSGQSVNPLQARDELDAVVSATKEATDNIMNACEAMQAFAKGQNEDVQNMVNEQVTRIFEACSFQDITGQRIAKVISLLHVVEDKVGHMLAAINAEGGHAPAHKQDDDVLMNGPQLPNNALSQEDIDKLLASFD